MAWETLFLTEGFAVGASGHTGILLMGAHKDVVQRAVVLASAVIGALCDGALDALVGMTVHSCFLLLFDYGNSMAWVRKSIQEINSKYCILTPLVIL